MPTRQATFPTHPYVHPIPPSRNFSGSNMDILGNPFSPDFRVQSQAQAFEPVPNGLDFQAAVEIQNFWSDCERYAALVAALEEEKRAHAQTRLALETEAQRSRTLEGEVYNKTNMAATWAAAYQQCYGNLQQHISEKTVLETKVSILNCKIQRSESRGKFHLDATAPKDRQIQVLRRKLARLSRGSGSSCSDVEEPRNSSRSQSPTSEYS
ncbi:hypothetical protein B0J12DRAFT_780495, partial [Macrophomina phaseolina]